MNDQDDELKQMVRCAQLFYEDDLPQAKIASKLGLSTSKVSRLIRSARRYGLVEVRIKVSHIRRMEINLMNQFDLRDAVVVQSRDDGNIKTNLGEAAARYFERTVKDRSRIYLSGGETIFEFVNEIRPSDKQLDIYSFSVWHADDTYLSAYTLAGLLCAKHRRRSTVHGVEIPWSMVKDNPSAFQSFLATAAVQDACKGAQEVDIAIIGINNLSEDSRLGAFLRQAGINIDTVRKVAKGCIQYQAFDENGEIIPFDWYDKIALFPIERLREMIKHPTKHVIAIVGGKEKIPCIQAALKGRFFDILITDEEIALELLRAA
jgi:deoxyribonucleoside regulator